MRKRRRAPCHRGVDRRGKLIERAENVHAGLPALQRPAAQAPSQGEPEPTPIFLPVGLVTGLTGADTSMLCRMRETGDVLALRLLIDLYGEVTLDAAVCRRDPGHAGICGPARDRRRP